MGSISTHWASLKVALFLGTKENVGLAVGAFFFFFFFNYKPYQKMLFTCPYTSGDLAYPIKIIIILYNI